MPTTPTYSFTNLQWGEIYDAHRQEKAKGAVKEAYHKVFRPHLERPDLVAEFCRCQVRPLGPYALRTVSSETGEATMTYGEGKGELLIIEPPENPGTITFLPNTRPPLE